MVRVLLDKVMPETVEQMRQELLTDEIAWFVSESNKSFREAAFTSAPHVAVLSGIHRCIVETRRKVELLKELCPRIRIIAISAEPSEDDGVIIEQGLFFYMTSTDMSALFRIVHAAVSASKREHEATA